MEIVPTLSWSNPNRILIHICDSPCHGKEFHDFEDKKDDKYPKGDPKNRELSKLLLNIKRLKINYCTIQLNSSTKKMFEEFTFIYGAISEIYVTDPKALMASICKETSSLIMTNVESTMSSFRTSCKSLKPYTILSKEPDWNSIKVCAVRTIEVITPMTMEDLFRPLFVGTGNGRMKIAPNPFAQGSLRFAFYGQFSSDECEIIDVVFKEFSSSDPDINTLEVYKEHLEIQVIAQYLANRFNTEMIRLFRKPVFVVYADADLVQEKDDESKIYQVEARMHQNWHKWNNNSGGVSFSEYSTVLQAFSHWTYHITAGRLMIVDLQGVKAEGAYLLTDPAIHCDNLLRFKHTRTNLGVKGMNRFFHTHICSEVCSKLELPLSPKSETLNENQIEDLSEFYQILGEIDKMDEETVKFESDSTFEENNFE